MLKRLQIAYYQEGQAIADRGVIAGIANELGFEPESFMATFDLITADSLQDHIKRSNEMLEALNARGLSGICAGDRRPNGSVGHGALFKPTCVVQEGY